MPTITYTPIPIILLANSASTSSAMLVQDYNVISLQVDSATTNPVVAVQASNYDGLQPDGGPYGVVRTLVWSTITSILTGGVFSVTPGMRWLRTGSPVSAATVVLAGNAF